MNKHTQGTWEMDGPQIVGNGYGIGHVNSHRTTEGKANALLFAAAPDLLEALEDIIASECRQPDIGCAWTKARAAIARTKGESV